MISSEVFMIKCKDYNSENVYKAVKLLIEKDKSFPDVQGKSVLIKPNLLYPVSPEKAVTTHPAVVEAIIRIVKSKGAASISVGDSPGVSSMENAGKKTGVKDVVNRQKVLWQNFSDPTLLEYSEGKIQKQFYPARVVCESDIIISLPKLKTHEMMYFTGSMKNLFGTIPGLKKSRFHFNFPEKEDFASMIVDLNGALKADYAIMDAIIAMEGPGPGSGYPKPLGFLASSSNLLALDSTSAKIIGYIPEEIPILAEALNRKIWLNSFDEITYPLEKPENLRPENFQKVKILKDTGFVKNILPNPLYKFIKDIYVPRPLVSTRHCIACGKCVEICPPDAMSIEQKRKKKSASVDYSKCIRCYCCHEVCPVNAIRVSRC